MTSMETRLCSPLPGGRLGLHLSKAAPTSCIRGGTERIAWIRASWLGERLEEPTLKWRYEAPARSRVRD